MVNKFRQHFVGDYIFLVKKKSSNLFSTTYVVQINMYLYHTFNFFFIELLGLFKSFSDVATVKARIASAFFVLMDEILNRLPRHH